VHVSATAVAVRLDPAPLDVVLDMAGYFRSIDSVGWLGERRMTFAIADADGRPARA
jgi:hypothetical protein